MLPVHMSGEETSFAVHCGDQMFQNMAVVSDSSPNETLFHVEGATWGTSWIVRRKLYEGPLDRSPSMHLLGFRHGRLEIKNGWVVEAAGDGRVIVNLTHRDFFTKQHSAINATVHTMAGDKVLVTMRHVADEGAMMDARVGDGTFAIIEKTDNELALVGPVVLAFESSKDKPQSAWKVRVAAGVDLSLVIVFALCRIEMRHVWGKKISLWCRSDILYAAYRMNSGRYI